MNSVINTSIVNFSLPNQTFLHSLLFYIFLNITIHSFSITGLSEPLCNEGFRVFLRLFFQFRIISVRHHHKQYGINYTVYTWNTGYRFFCVEKKTVSFSNFTDNSLYQLTGLFSNTIKSDIFIHTLFITCF